MRFSKIASGLSIEPRDLAVSGLASILAAASWTLPEARWLDFAGWIAGRRIALRSPLSQDELATIRLIVGPRSQPWIETTFWPAWLAHKYHGWMQIFACHWPRRWQPACRLIGQQHIDAALAHGRGVMLFTATFAYKDLMAKAALAEAGFRVSHLSKDTHGLSETRFGKRWLNPAYTRIEERFLAERLVFSGSNTKDVSAKLRDRLENNRPVMVTVTPLGRQVVGKPFMHGRINIATGGLNFACEIGTPVLPVFTIRASDGTTTTFVERPLERAGDVSREAMIEAMLNDYVPRLEAHAERHPEQFSFPLSDRHGEPFLSEPAAKPAVAERIREAVG